MNLHNLWPTTVAEFDIPEDIVDSTLAQLADETYMIRGIDRPDSSGDLLHLDARFGLAVGEINRCAESLLDHWAISRTGHRITGLWANRQTGLREHAPHQHANSFISGCWYLTAPEDSSSIEFMDPRPATWAYRVDAGEQFDWNCAMLWRPRRGMLLLWPSWLQHRTVAMDAGGDLEPRISMAFNMHITTDYQGHSARYQFP